jgi:hypothetical protein
MSNRSKLLLLGAPFAPAVVVLVIVQYDEVTQQVRAWGYQEPWTNPFALESAMIAIGLVCFVAFVISNIVDLRRAK